MRVTHSYWARLSHWLLALSVIVMGASGFQIFRAFPSFSGKLRDPIYVPLPPLEGLGGWLGGALDWHFTFAWAFGAGMVLYAVDLAQGGWRRLWMTAEECRGILPMVRYYLLRRPKPTTQALYNPLQKITYVFVAGSLLLALVTGGLLAQPVQLSVLIRLAGGWQVVRAMHFLSLCIFAGFLPGHIVMVALAGKPAWAAMVSGQVHSQDSLS